jgi:hypothetical protein
MTCNTWAVAVCCSNASRVSSTAVSEFDRQFYELARTRDQFDGFDHADPNVESVEVGTADDWLDRSWNEFVYGCSVRSLAGLRCARSGTASRRFGLQRPKDPERTRRIGCWDENVVVVIRGTKLALIPCSASLPATAAVRPLPPGWNAR